MLLTAVTVHGHAVIHLQASDFLEGSFKSHKVFHTRIHQMPTTFQCSSAGHGTQHNSVYLAKPDKIKTKLCLKCTYVCICFETMLDLTFPVYIQLKVDLRNSLILPPLKQACNQHISTNKNRDKNTRTGCNYCRCGQEKHLACTFTSPKSERTRIRRQDVKPFVPSD